MFTQQTIQELSHKNKEPEWLLKQRLDAFKKFTDLDMPIFKYGPGIFTDSTGLQLDTLTLAHDQQHITAPNTVQVLSLQEALQSHPDVIKQQVNHETEHKLSALHHAFFTNGTLIIIPKNTNVEQPILIDLALTNSFINSIIIYAEQGSAATIIETTKSQEQQLLRSQHLTIIAEDDTLLNYYTIQDTDKKTHHFTKRTAQLNTHATLNWHDCFIGAQFTHAQTTTNLNGEGAETSTYSIVYGDEHQCYDLHNETHHYAPRTYSNMITRMVLNDHAKSVFRGLVKIHKNATQCNGHQKEETILLSEHAETDPIPNLEIENHDVKCSHAATISHIDNDKLFYLMSRGLSETEAKRSIIEGFFTPIMTTLNETMGKEIETSMTKRLQHIQ